MRYVLLILAAMFLHGHYVEAQSPLSTADGAATRPSATLLSRLGMDMRLLDTIQNRRPLLASERECFYAMLAAAGRAKPFELERTAFAELNQQEKRDTRQPTVAGQTLSDVVPLFNDPASQMGRLIIIEGDARRAVEIRVDNPDIERRYSIRRYFEIAIFTGDSQGNPLICCVLEVPKEMPLGENIFAHVRVAGFFMKSWAYPRGGATSSEAKEQLAPLILGREARLLATVGSTSDAVLNSIVVGGVLVAVAGILWAAWRAGRSSRVADNLSQKRSPPDFSGLDV